MAVGQHDVRAVEYIPVPIWIRLQQGRRVHSRKNGIVRRVGKFILKMLLLGHQITASGLQRSSVANVEIAFPSVRL